MGIGVGCPKGEIVYGVGDKFGLEAPDLGGSRRIGSILRVEVERWVRSDTVGQERRGVDMVEIDLRAGPIHDISSQI